MRLQNIYILGSDEFRNGTFRIIQIAGDAGFGRTVVHAGGIHSFFYAVETQGAFVHHTLLRMEVTTAIWASLDTIFAPNAIFLIYQYDAIFCFKGSANRTNLYARGFSAMITHLWHEECLFNLICRYRLCKTINPSIGSFDFERSIFPDGVLFDPTPEEEWLLRDIVLNLAGLGAGTASDAFFNIDGYSVPWALCVSFNSSK